MPASPGYIYPYIFQANSTISFSYIAPKILQYLSQDFEGQVVK